MNAVGLQLYTIRDYLTEKTQCEKALLAVKNAGYSFVQLAGDKDMITLSANACKKLGIKVYGILTDINFCYENSHFLFSIAKETGATDLGISGWIDDMKDPLSFIERINDFAKLAGEKGFTFSYHNHACEFVKTASGKTAMDILIENFDEAVSFMPDTYWLQHAGVSVCDFLRKISGRITALHLKDMKVTGNDHTFAEVGNGNLDFKSIVTTARECKVENFIVEQDTCDGDSLQSIKISYDAIKNL